MRDERDFERCLVKAQDIIDAERARNAKLLTERDALRARVAELENATMSERDIEDMGYMRLPVDKDGVPVRPGDTVYGGDGKAWYVKHVGTSKHSVNGVQGAEMRQMRPRWLTHEPPRRFPLDADGVECRPGDTVWRNVPDGARFTVVRPGTIGAMVVVEGDGGEQCLLGMDLTHAEPDSWERLEADVKKFGGLNGFAYWGCEGSCSDCPAAIGGETPLQRYGVDFCSGSVCHDILRRAMAIAGVSTPKCSEATPKGEDA